MEELDLAKIKIGAYSRKSTDGKDRQALSLNDQKRELEPVIKQKSLKIVANYLGDEYGERRTAHKLGRPIFNRLMSHVESGAVNGILVWHPNRLARNPVDAARIIYAMDEGQLLTIITPRRVYYNTPEDKKELGHMFVESKGSSDDNSVAVKRGLKTKREMGHPPGRAMIGYRNSIFNDKGKNEWLVDEERFSVVRELWRLLLTGNYSVMELLEEAHERNLTARPTRKHPLGKSVSRSHLYKIFKDRRYCGQFESPKGSDKWFPGAYTPMITEDEYWEGQTYLGDKGMRRPKGKHRFPFSGLMRCGRCGSGRTPDVKYVTLKDGRVKRLVYYVCNRKKDPNCHERSIEESELMTQVDALLERITIPERLQKWAIETLHEVRKEEAQSHQTVLANKQAELGKVDEQLHSLLLTFTSPQNQDHSLVSEQEYKSLRDDLLKRKNDLQGDVQAQGKVVEDWLELSERTFNFARYARVWFAQGDLMTKRAIFNALGSKLTVTEQKVAIELRPVFRLIQENLPAVEAEIQKVRSPIFVEAKGFNAPSCDNFLSGRRVRDSNPRCLATHTLSKRAH
jgi:site-specific DNA recombinase